MSVCKRLKSWAAYYICWCRAAAIVSVLVFGYKVVRYTILTVLITFFIDYPNDFKLVKAARYATFMEAAEASFEIIVAYMSDALFSRFKILSYSVLSIIAGLLLFYINLILWGNYNSLYIIGIVFIAAGESGLLSVLDEFLADQLWGHTVLDTNKEDQDRVEEAPVEDGEETRREAPAEDGEEGRREDKEEARKEDLEEDEREDPADAQVRARKGVWRSSAWVCSVIATFVISNYSWEVIFLTSTLMLTGSFVLFMFGISFYHRKDIGGEGSSLCNFIPVIKASLLKRHLCYPSSPDLFHENDGIQTHLSPQVKILRWLDKAAIIESSGLSKQQQEKAGRLCTVSQVKESKLLLKMIPMWSTFLVVGLVASTGDTFSSEQGKNLDNTDFTFYLIIFVKPISKVAISYLYNKLLTSERFSKDQLKLGKIMRIWFGMVLSTIFCVVAWRVEVRRLQIVRRKRNNPGVKINNMSIFWLVPQYCLLGLMEGSSTTGLEQFMTGELPKSLRNYVSAMNGFVIDGIGSFLSILYVNANGGLFSDTMNDSRLDKYYFRLLLLSFLNMCYYYPISIIYRPIRYF